MKLHDLIDELTKIAAGLPEAEVTFQTTDMGQVWFPTKPTFFIDARKDGDSCRITFGPSECIAADYKREADIRDQQKK